MYLRDTVYLLEHDVFRVIDIRHAFRGNLHMLPLVPKRRRWTTSSVKSTSNPTEWIEHTNDDEYRGGICRQLLHLSLSAVSEGDDAYQSEQK